MWIFQGDLCAPVAIVTLFPHIDFNMLLCCSSLHVVLFSMILLALFVLMLALQNMPCSIVA
jgi:hypothetical protein